MDADADADSPTNEDAEICGDHVQCRDVLSSTSHHTTDTRQHSGKTDDGMQRRNHLRELRRRDPAADDCASHPADRSDAGELHEYFGREADGAQGGEDTRSDT